MPFDRSSPARCFMTPPPSWNSRPSRSPTMPLSERKRPASVKKGDLFHIIHKVPAGDSPYVKAKQVQLVDKDPGRAISMFWAAINAGDRVESALKDMALVMKQLNRSDEAIEAIKSFRHLCPADSQESLDNILVELYKRSGRVDEEIAMLHHKLKQIEDGVTFVGRTIKQARSQGKKIQITAEQEISRILGNLAWAYMQKGDYKTAEEHYRKALSFEPDRNKQCNLAICLMQMNRITEAKFLLQAVCAASKNRKVDDSFTKSFERASQMLNEIESSSLVDPIKEKEGTFKETQRSLMSHISQNSKESNSSDSIGPIGQHHTGFSLSRNWDKEFRESFGQNSLENMKTKFAVSSMSQCSPQSWPVDELKKDSYIENSCAKSSDLVKGRTENWSVTSEVEVSYARRRLYKSPDPARRDMKVPYTKPKRCSWGFNNGYRREIWGDVHSDHKSSFGSPPNDKYNIMLPKSTESDLPSPANGKWRARILEDPATVTYEDAAVISSDSLLTLNTESAVEFTEKDKSAADDSKWRSKLSESHHMPFDGAKEYATSFDIDKNQGSDMSVSNSAVDKSFGNNERAGNSINLHEFASGNRKPFEKKSWADIVEEEEQENEEQDLFSGIYTNFDVRDSAEVFNDENENSNKIYQRPWPQSQTECLSKKLESFDQKDGYNVSGNVILSRNPTVRRSLCFDPELTPESTYFICTSTSPKKASNLEGRRMLAKERDSLSGEKKLTRRRNRLQVFQDITLHPETP